MGFGVTYVKDIDVMNKKDAIILAQKVNDLGENVKVSMNDKRMVVTGIGRYDWEKTKVMDEEHFSCWENDSVENGSMRW